MSEHSKLSPSSSHRWMHCPGSVALSEGVPDSDSEFAREGTFAHDIASRTLMSTNPKATQFLGHSDGEFTCDREMAQHVQTYVDAVMTRALLASGKVLIEQRVHLLPDVHGTADAIVFDDNRIDVYDLKYGAGTFVEVNGNSQAMIYAAGALRTHPDECPDATTIGLHIVQPRRLDGAGDAHRFVQMDIGELDDWVRGELTPAVDRIQRGDQTLAVGSWCQFCPAKATCPALHENALQAAADVFPQGDVHDPVQPPDPASFSAEELAKLLETADMVELWLKAVRENATKRAAVHGTAIPGYKLVQKQGNRKWVNEAEAEQRLTQAGIDPYAPRKVLSPAQAEKKLGRAGKKLVDGMTTRPLGDVILVPESNTKHLPYNPGAVFGKVDSAPPEGPAAHPFRS